MNEDIHKKAVADESTATIERPARRWTPTVFASLRSGIQRQHSELALSDPNNPRIKVSLPRLAFLEGTAP